MQRKNEPVYCVSCQDEGRSKKNRLQLHYIVII